MFTFDVTYRPSTLPGGKPSTTMTIYDDMDNLIAQGTVWCAPQDNFSRRLGRKLALTRAIEHFDRDFRTKVWHDYFDSGARV